jgi:hypothetical protein
MKFLDQLSNYNFLETSWVWKYLKEEKANGVALNKCVFIAHEVSLQVNTKATALISRTYAKILTPLKVK